VRIVAASWKVVRTFQAYETGTITHMRQVEGTSLLVTVAVGVASPSNIAWFGSGCRLMMLWR
jgi:hypothetical protein